MTTASERKIRVLVAEDSPTGRAHLVAILLDDPAVEIVAEAADGTEAVDLTAALRPDCVVMDILMPGLNGFEATEQIMDSAPTPIVMVSAALDVREAEIGTKALAAGAAAVMPKPPGPGAPDAEWACRQFVETVKALGRVRVRRRPRPRIHRACPTVIPVPPVPAPAPGPGVLAMTAGRGGPTALTRLLGALPDEVATPILVVQHMPPHFLDRLAHTLDSALRRDVRVARDGEPLRPRTVYLAPDGAHLGVRDRETVRVVATAPVNGFRPSATWLFRSVARVFGTRACAVVLTGLGLDGLPGLEEVRRAGGTVVAQAPDGATEPRLPRAVVERGLADMVVGLDQLPAMLAAICRGGPRSSQARPAHPTAA